MQSVKLTEKAVENTPDERCRHISLDDGFCLWGFIWGDMAVVPIGDELKFYSKEEYELCEGCDNE